MTEHSRGRSLGGRIARASLSVGIAHVLFKIVGVLQLAVMARYLGERTIDVVYVVVFEGCIFSLFLIGEEVIGPTFLPLFTQEHEEHGEPAAWRFANVILTLQTLVLLVVIGLVALFPGDVIRLFTAWTAESSPDKFLLARRVVTWMAPALLGLSLGSTTYMILNGYKRFFIAAFGDAMWKLCVLAAVALGVGLFGLDYRALVFGLVVGSGVKLLTHLVGLLGELRFLRPCLRVRHPAVRRMLLLMLPLICGIVFAKVRDVFNNVWVLSRLETDGLLTANSFGRKLYTTIGWLVPYSISIAIFPFLCELADRDERERFGAILSQSGRMLLAIFIPVAGVCAVLARPVALLLFHGGRLTMEAVEWTAVATACYVLVLPAFALEYLLMQAFFARQKMVSVTVVGVAFSFVSMLVSYAGIVMFGARGAAALAVIALGFAASRTLKTISLVYILKRSLPLFPIAETLGFLLRSVTCAVVTAAGCAGCVLLFERGVSVGDAKLVLLAKLAAGGVGAALCFLASVWLLRIREPFEMVEWAWKRVCRGRG